jgi:hypothetical protein
MKTLLTLLLSAFAFTATADIPQRTKRKAAKQPAASGAERQKLEAQSDAGL